MLTFLHLLTRVCVYHILSTLIFPLYSYWLTMPLPLILSLFYRCSHPCRLMKILTRMHDLHGTRKYCTAPYCTVLYSAVLYYTMWCYAMWHFDMIKYNEKINEMKWNEMKWNEMKWNEMKWNDMEGLRSILFDALITWINICCYYPLLCFVDCVWAFLKHA